ELGGGWAWRAAGYAGFRPATLNELHRPFRVGNTLTEANPGLEPERLYGVETGVDLARGPLTLAATVFRNRLENAITNVTLATGPGTFAVPGLPGVSDVIGAGGFLRMRENAGAVDATGLEAEAVEAVLGDGLQLRAAVAYTYSVVDGGSAAPQLDGLRPALTPRATVTGEARWRPTASTELTLETRYESRRYDDDLNTLPLHAAISFDLQASYALTPALSLFLAADNLFDAGVQTAESALGVYSYDAPRLVRVGVRLRR
ncbi:MAG: TonB-dependent receptor, partial [Caulobacteraceae bacterium]|nr:TonB-dependent receptor [Caulobacter sp.]